MKTRTCLLAMAFAACFCAFSAEQPEWEHKPIEIITGDLPAPHYPTIWSAQNSGIEPPVLSVEGDGSLELSADYCLWNEKSAKLTFNSTPGRMVIKPGNISFDKKIDGLELWIYGFKSGIPKNSFEIIDANGKSFTLRTNGNSSYWSQTPWWCTTTAIIPKAAAFPIRLTKIIFEASDKITPGDSMYFDFLAPITFSGQNLPDTSKWKTPFPYKKESILPTPASLPKPISKPVRTSAKRSKDSYVFTSIGDFQTVEYIYTPKTGTLGDISVSIQGQYEENGPLRKNTFIPMAEGGIMAEIDGVKILSDDKSVKATLKSIRLKKQKLTASWRLEKGEASLEYLLELEIKGGSLVITASSNSTDIYSFSCGRTENTLKPRLIKLSYLNYRWDYPRILVTDDYFVSLFPDWYVSHASEVADGGSAQGIQGAKVLDDNSARIMGGSIYNRRTDGIRNPLYERYYLTVSENLDSVMPNIPNPKSLFFDETKSLVYCTRSYNALDPGDSQAEVDFWRLMADYGVRDVFVRFHMNMWRTPLRNNHFTHYNRTYQNVGDDDYKMVATELKKILRRVGPYEDNRVSHPLGPEFSYDQISRNSDGSFILGWDNSFQPSPAAQHKLQADFSPGMISKFGWNACYFDEVTNTPPWGMVDYNHAVPGGGTYLNVLRNYAFVARKQSDYYKGPIWSEGNAAMFWAGYLDTDYAQCNDPDSMPVVDYKLKKINMLENLNGYDLTRIKNTSLDYKLSAQIAFGNMGHIWGGSNSGIPYMGSNVLKNASTEDIEDMCRSYFMMRQLQELYAGVEPVRIVYRCKGQMLTATQMFRKNLENEGMVYIFYANGLNVWVNRNPEKNWEIQLGEYRVVLPPYGFAAWLPGKLMEFSGIFNGNRVDYSAGPLYTYMNGHGKMTPFPGTPYPGAWLANAYVIFREKNAITFTPVPFISEESIELQHTGKLTALDRDGTPRSPGSFVIENGRISFNTSKDAFRYRLE